MEREYWKPANMLYPVPAVLVSCRDEEGKDNIMTAAWAGTVCSDPVMVSVSIRKERYSHDIIERTGEFVISLTTRDLVYQTDWCGVRSGRNIDKFEAMHLHRMASRFVKAPGIEESPVCLECRVREVLHLGSHDMFIGEVLSTDVDPAYLDEKGKLDLKRADLIAYLHGEYFTMGECLGSFGFSVRRKQEEPGKGPGKEKESVKEKKSGERENRNRGERKEEKAKKDKKGTKGRGEKSFETKKEGDTSGKREKGASCNAGKSSGKKEGKSVRTYGGGRDAHSGRSRSADRIKGKEKRKK